MVADDFVIGDLVVRVLGTREQVDPSTKPSWHGLRAVIEHPIVADDVVAAAANDHQAVVTVVAQHVVGDLRTARPEQHDAFKEIHAWRQRRRGIGRLAVVRVHLVLADDGAGGVVFGGIA